MAKIRPIRATRTKSVFENAAESQVSEEAFGKCNDVGLAS